MELCLRMIEKPVGDNARFERIYEDYVYAMKDQYSMND
jgi:hypothetical protein